MTTDITIPRIDLPFAVSQEHPLQDGLYPATLEWARRFGLVTREAAAERLRRYRLELCSYYAPTVDSGPALQLLTDWITWAVVFEDQIDEATAGLRPDLLAPVLDEFRAILRDDPGMPAPSNPAMAALADLWQRTAADSGPQWRQRFYDHVSDQFRAELRASIHRATRTPMDIATCIELRAKTGWVTFTHDLQHHIHRVWVPDTVYCSTPYQTLLWSAADILMWTNDLFSYTRESAFGELNNLAIVLQTEQGLAPQQAVNRVHAMIDDRVADFVKAGRALPDLVRSLRLPPDAARGAEHGLTHLRTLVRGSYDWHLSCERYQHGPDITANLHTLDDLFGITQAGGDANTGCVPEEGTEQAK
ncbi:terpene synthase family protein [Streptomyces lavendulae]|uniref:terpene synthase family protein n=1 Tax=Streptomyces lavendulae TaxID=1914 RepID=UPI00333477FD